MTPDHTAETPTPPSRQLASAAMALGLIVAALIALVAVLFFIAPSAGAAGGCGGG